MNTVVSHEGLALKTILNILLELWGRYLGPCLWGFSNSIYFMVCLFDFLSNCVLFKVLNISFNRHVVHFRQYITI